jgi:hypothetical protein
MKLKSVKPSPAMVVACLALFVALGGTAVAARQYLITSTDQIKPSVLSELTASSRGLDVEIYGPEVSIKAGGIGVARAECPSGEHLVTGGYEANLSPGGVLPKSSPQGPSAWMLLIDNTGATKPSTARAQALCAPGRAPAPVGHVFQPPRP